MTTNARCETTVVVIDDEESMRQGCCQALEEKGFRSRAAEDGESGLRLVEHLKPDVVLVDLKMPGMDGMEVLEKIPEINEGAVSIVITGYGTAESAVQAMRLGATDYLCKPFDDQQLLRTVRRGLERHRVEKASAELGREEEMARDNFAAAVCHQLKSPVAAASQSIETLLREGAGTLNLAQKLLSDRAHDRLAGLADLIEGWIELAGVEAGTAEFDPQFLDPAEVIKDAWQSIPDDDARGRILFQLNTEEHMGPVLGCRRLLRELFANLFTNSVKFTSGPGTVTVDIVSEEKSIVVFVQDTGMGIPEEELAHLFEPFYRGTRAGVKRTGGSGLGLAVVKRIVSAHGGTISAHSRPGQGATFTVRLPMARDTHSTAVRERVAPIARPKPIPRAITKALPAGRFLDFVREIIADQSVIGVKVKEDEEDRFVFGSLQRASELRLDYDVTVLSPKKYLLPARETLVKFTLGNSPEATPCIEEPQAFVLMGVHPYDMIAINQLDRTMSEGNPDPNYLARRSAVTVIGVDPDRASEHAFWSSMGCATVENGFDLWLTNIGGAYLVEVGTEKGASLLEKYTDARDASRSEMEARAELRDELQEMGKGRTVKFKPAELPALLRRCFDHDVWELKAEKCLSCGSCNIACPTCYCFDVKDEVDMSMKRGERYRVWDGCVLQDFAKVGTGENFRKDRLQRYRHRFYRKGMYLYDKYGHIACVGCGRCAAACLPGIADPVEVYNLLKEDSSI
ncbi:4Fe-4S dicluster domain-containing protein [Planctomycetota bacterium]